MILSYDENQFLVDSSIYSHDISLSEKYIYVVGANEGLKLKREFGKEKYYHINLKMIVLVEELKPHS